MGMFVKNAAWLRQKEIQAARSFVKIAVMKKQQMKAILNNIFYGLAVVLMFDLMILFVSMAQIAVEGRTGHWNEFWLWQARLVIKIVHQ